MGSFSSAYSDAFDVSHVFDDQGLGGVELSGVTNSFYIFNEQGSLGVELSGNASLRCVFGEQGQSGVELSGLATIDYVPSPPTPPASNGAFSNAFSNAFDVSSGSTPNIYSEQGQGGIELSGVAYYTFVYTPQPEPPPQQRPEEVLYPSYDLAGTFAVFGGPPPNIALTFLHGRHIYSNVKKRRKDIKVNLLKGPSDRSKLSIHINNVELVEGSQPELIRLVGMKREPAKVRKYGQVASIQE